MEKASQLKGVTRQKPVEVHTVYVHCWVAALINQNWLSFVSNDDVLLYIISFSFEISFVFISIVRFPSWKRVDNPVFAAAFLQKLTWIIFLTVHDIWISSLNTRTNSASLTKFTHFNADLSW